MRTMIPRPWVILLAAGASRRFGGPKLLARIHGESVLRRAARVALGCRPAGCVVVLGARSVLMRRELRGFPFRLVVNRRWQTGLAGSLRAGIAALPRAAPAALVQLADQVAIGPADLELLIAAWQKAPRSIVTARASGMRTPPAIFPRRVFRDLNHARGDQGARAVLRDPGRSVIEFEMPGAAVDLDRPSDLKRLTSLKDGDLVPRSARSSRARRPTLSGGT